MKINTCVALLFCLGVKQASAQSTKYRYRLYVSSGHMVYKDSTANTDLVQLSPGATITSEKKYTLNGVAYTSASSQTLTQPQTIFAEKKIPQLVSLSGWANITVDSTDQSKLHVNYWLGKPYDELADYYIKLKNRERVGFWFKCIEGGALTIPFRYRPSFTKNNKVVTESFTADLNAGTYLGLTIGRVSYTYKRHENTNPSQNSITVGPFFSASVVSVDSTNTTTASPPYKTATTMATFTSGLAVMASIKDFRLGIFRGVDAGFGKNASAWDYNKRWWWGFGLGYNIGLIWGGPKG